MTKLLLVRHGESEANRHDLFAGFYDAELEEQGLRQAELTAEFISENYNVHKVYASDLKRAYKTGQAIAARCSVEIIPEQGLREISGGEWEGVHFPSLKELYPQEFGLWLTDIGNAGCPGGETVKDFANRVMSTMEKIAKLHDGQTIVVATHATPIRVVHTMLLHGDIAAMRDVSWVSNASVTEIQYDLGKWQMIRSGYDSHLADLRTYLNGNI